MGPFTFVKAKILQIRLVNPLVCTLGNPSLHRNVQRIKTPESHGKLYST